MTDSHRFTVQRSGSKVYVTIVGDIIIGNRTELRHKVEDEIHSGGRHFTVDLGRTGYLDAAALGVFVSLSKQVRQAGGTFELRNPNTDVLAVFRITHLDTLFTIDGVAPRAREHAR